MVVIIDYQIINVLRNIREARWQWGNREDCGSMFHMNLEMFFGYGLTRINSWWYITRCSKTIDSNWFYIHPTTHATVHLWTIYYYYRRQISTQPVQLQSICKYGRFTSYWCVTKAASLAQGTYYTIIQNALTVVINYPRHCISISKILKALLRSISPIDLLFEIW